jgi:hypothetical protein
MKSLYTLYNPDGFCLHCGNAAIVKSYFPPLKFSTEDGPHDSIGLCQNHYVRSRHIIGNLTLRSGHAPTLTEYLCRCGVSPSNKSVAVPGWLFNTDERGQWAWYDNHRVTIDEYKYFELWCKLNSGKSLVRMQPEFESQFLMIRERSHEVFKNYLLSYSTEHTQNVPGSALNEPEEADLSKPTTLNSW